MSPFLQQYANNLAVYLYWPVVGSTLFAALFAGFSFMDYLKNKYAVHSQEYNDNNWRTMAAINYIILAWIVFGLIAAVPKPNYLIQTKIIHDTKIVTKTGTYAEAYNACGEG